MKLLQCGAPKSGNFWLYKIIGEILKEDGRETESFVQKQPIYQLAQNWKLNFPGQSKIDVLEVTDFGYSYRIGSIFRMPVEDIQNYVETSPHIWSHSPVCKKSGELFDRLDKIVYIIRDPRDRALSASKYYCSEYMLKYFPQEETDPQRFLEKNFDRLMHTWLWHVFDYLRLSQKHHIHICFFEGFLADFQKELDLLLDYLEIELNPDQREQLENAMLFKTLKKSNPQHLNKGKSGYWKESLPPNLIERAQILTGPLLDFLGYNRSGKFDLSRKYNPRELEDIKSQILMRWQESS